MKTKEQNKLIKYNNIVDVLDNIEQVKEQLETNIIYIDDVGAVTDFLKIEEYIRVLDSYKNAKFGKPTIQYRSEHDPETQKILDYIVKCKQHKKSNESIKESLKIDLDVNISLRTVTRYIKHLQDVGILERQRKPKTAKAPRTSKN